MTVQPQHHYLLANIQGEGIKEALDAGWQRHAGKVGGQPGLLTPGEQVVAVTSNANRLMDLSPDTVIYISSRWLHAYGDARGALRAHKQRGGKVLRIDGTVEDWA